MKTITFLQDNQLHLGVKTVKGVLNVNLAIEILKDDFDTFNVPKNQQELITRGEKAHQALHALIDVSLNSNFNLFLDEESIEFGPCVTDPQKIICVGLNYRKHAIESNMDIPNSPILFNKYNNSLTGHNSSVKLPKESSNVDYEAEFAIVIGKEAKNVSEDEALLYVYGYCNANDLSARDLQFKTNQWLLGKTCDGFCPVGPYLVSADEIEDPNNLKICLKLNGEVRQDSNTSDLIFNCQEIISYISKHMTLMPGDLILTGTPSGVIFGLEEDKQVWLKDGDEIIVEIEGLGRLVTNLRKE